MTTESLPALRCPECRADWPLPVRSAQGVWPGFLQCAACGTRRELPDGVLQLDDEDGEGDYPPECYDVVAPVEERHWWHASRNSVIARALRPQLGRRQLRTALEVGCGTGFVLAGLERLGLSCVGLDMQLEGLRHARGRVAAPLIRSGRPGLPFAAPFDLVALCDVLEHAEEGPLLAACRDALRPARREASGRVARPAGLLLLTVPAIPALWSLEDEMSGHRRRYTAATLKAALRAAGLRPLLLRPFHAALVPLAFWQRRVRRRRAPDPPPTPAEFFRGVLKPPSPRASRWIGAVLALENRCGALLPLPLGSSLLALAEPA